MESKIRILENELLLSKNNEKITELLQNNEKIIEDIEIIKNKYECNVCNKTFKTFSGSNRHKKRNNCGNMKEECIHCFRKFKHKSSLCRHKKTCKISNLEELQKVKEQLNIMKQQIDVKDKLMEEQQKEIIDLKHHKL
jgi:hypothetical protein